MKRLFTFILCSSCCISSFGQVHSVGIKGGASLTKLSRGSEGWDTYFKPGFMFGTDYQYESNKGFLFSTEIVYENKGYRSETIITDTTGKLLERYSSKYWYDYINLSLKAGYHFGGKIQPFIFLGLVPGLIMRERYISGYYLSETAYSFPVNRFDLNALIEGGCSFELSPHLSLNTSFRFQHSLFDGTKLYVNYSKLYGFTLSTGISYKLK